MQISRMVSVYNYRLAWALASLFIFVVGLFTTGWSAWLGWVLVLLAVANGALVAYAVYRVVRPPRLRFYNVTFSGNRVSGRDDLNYILKDVIFQGAVQNPMSPFYLCLTRDNKNPILGSLLPPETIRSIFDAKYGRSGFGIVLREIKQSPISGGIFYYGLVRDDQVPADFSFNMAAFLEENKEMIRGVGMGVFYSGSKQETLLGHVFVWSERKDNQILARFGDSLKVLKTFAVMKTAFASLYSPFYRMFIKTSISDDLFEAVTLRRFGTVRNLPIKFADNSGRWVVGMGGDSFDYPVFLGETSLVIQDVANWPNPAAVWVSGMMSQDLYKNPFVVLDFTGNISRVVGADLRMAVAEREVLLVKLNTETPDHVINLLNIWAGVPDEHRGEVIASLLYHLGLLTDANSLLYPSSSDEQLLSVRAILQGAGLLLTLKQNEFDFPVLISALKEMPAPYNFLKNVYVSLKTLYENAETNSLLEQIRHTLVLLGDAGMKKGFVPENVQISDLNRLYQLFNGVMSDPHNLVIVNGDSHYDLMNHASVVVDASGLLYEDKSVLPLLALSGLLHLIDSRRLCHRSVPHLVISGLSRLPETLHESMAHLLNTFLSGQNSCLILADERIVPVYTKMFLDRRIGDIYLFRSTDLGGLAPLVNKLKIDNTFALPRQYGYLLRSDPSTKKITPMTIYTARPSFRSLKPVSDW